MVNHAVLFQENCRHLNFKHVANVRYLQTWTQL